MNDRFCATNPSVIIGDAKALWRRNIETIADATPHAPSSINRPILRFPFVVMGVIKNRLVTTAKKALEANGEGRLFTKVCPTLIFIGLTKKPTLPISKAYHRVMIPEEIL